MQWNTQAGNINTNLKFKIKLTLPEYIATKIVMWNCHMYESSKGRYDMILGRDLLIDLGLNLKFSDHIIKAYDGTFKCQHHS